MNKTLKYCNPGIGDASFIHKDNALKRILATFPKGSNVLTVEPTGSMCGGYNYTIVCNSHALEIEKALIALDMLNEHRQFGEETEDIGTEK